MVCGLQALQEGADLGIGPVGVADHFAANDAIAVDDVGLRPSVGAVHLGHGLVGIADSGQVDVEALEEALVSIGVLVDAHGEDGDVGALVMELDQGGSLLDAGSAPAGPEIEQNNLTLVTGKMDGVLAVGNRKIGGFFANMRGFGAAIAPRPKDKTRASQRQPESEGEKTGGAHIPIILSGTSLKNGDQIGPDQERGGQIAGDEERRAGN